MYFQWMEQIIQDEIEFCCRLCPRTKGLWHSSTCEGLSSNTSKPCMTEVHHRMVEEEERMKLEDGRFFQQRKQAIHAKFPMSAMHCRRAQPKQWMRVQPPHMLKPCCKAELIKSKGSNSQDEGKRTPCRESFVFRQESMQVKVTEHTRLDRLGQFLLEMIHKDPKGPIGRPTCTTSSGSCPICLLAVDDDEYFMCVCCLSPIHEQCPTKCPCVEKQTLLDEDKCVNKSKNMDVDRDHVDEVENITEVSQSALNSDAVWFSEEDVDFDYDLTGVSEDEGEEGHEGHEDDKEGADEQGDSEQGDGE